MAETMCRNPRHRKRETTETPKTRTCLRCSKRFPSRNGARTCPLCRAINSSSGLSTVFELNL